MAVTLTPSTTITCAYPGCGITTERSITWLPYGQVCLICAPWDAIFGHGEAPAGGETVLADLEPPF